MQLDFHYYATYCAAFLSGYDHQESLKIAYSAQFVDCCSKTLLSKLKGPQSAATTQLQPELANTRTDIIGLQDITRIWSSFHFLPSDLQAQKPHRFFNYMQKYRLICDTNSDLLKETVGLAKGKGLAAVGLAMHVLADTWAHRYFAGTPSLVINNTDYYFYEMVPDGDAFVEKPITFRHSLSSSDDIENRLYTNALYQSEENSIMNLGHGRAGHLPDYSFIRYKYLPAWNEYETMVKDNPSDYIHAFCQMIYAMKYLRGDNEAFEVDTYDWEAISQYRQKIETILETRQLDSSADWKAFGEELSGCQIEDFDLEKYQKEYIDSPEDAKSSTFLGEFFLAAMAQKSMVTNQIYKSGNMLAGFSVDYGRFGFKGIKDFAKLIDYKKGGAKDE